ncbi:Kinase superfamily protein isoform 4 [Carex littledalei]|uniref:Kinase superfamily protein isoform 4 n=1 Tax=Carex littledalei TaxID=544730 RepID=A0A833QI53_9POAL|nr:Kinase superfamily protein isoform 4 [Carex littledalei]
MEVQTFECMSKHGQGPRLLGRFTNGRVEEFINARILSAADLRDPEISSLIAIKLQEFHNLHMPGPREVLLWPRLRSWTKKALDLCSAEEAKEFSLDNTGEEIYMLETALSRDGERIGFCHNDLQYGNIMIDEETRQVTIIVNSFRAHLASLIENCLTYPLFTQCGNIKKVGFACTFLELMRDNVVPPFCWAIN